MTEARADATPVSRLTAPTDVAGLVVFRVLLGLLVAIGALRFLLNGWIERFFLAPSFAFKYWGFAWVKAWPGPGMYLHFGLLVLLGLMLAAGAFYRVVAPLTFLAFTYVELLDVSTYLNHYYLLSLLLLLAAVMPLGDALSVDAWRRPERRRESFPAWCTWLLRAQVAVVYFYAGLAKLNAEWLIHGQPLNLWLGTMTELPHPWLQRFEVALAMSWAGFLYDTTIWLWLAWPRTRPYAFAVVAFFHLTVGLLFNIGMFPFIMVSAATVFFAPDWPRRALRRLRARGSQAGDSPPRARPMVGRWTKVGLALGAAFLLLQVLVPLRHLLYPGDVLWNELGMRWSWKVLVREKNGAVTFHLRLPDGKRQIVTPRKYLTDFQEREMSSQPDLILQLAHHIADDYAARGLGPVEVRAEARVSFNGRRSVLLLDPDVDLAQIEDGLGPAPWIRPAPGGPPVRLHPVAAR